METLEQLLEKVEKYSHGQNHHELKCALKKIMDNRVKFHQTDQHHPFSNALFKCLLLELDEEENDSIETAEIAYVHIGNSLTESPSAENIKLRLMLLHYFSDYFTDSIIQIFLEKYRKNNLLEARNLALECLLEMQITDMLRLENDFQDFIENDEQIQDICNALEMPDSFTEKQAQNAELMHKVLHSYLHCKYNK